MRFARNRCANSFPFHIPNLSCLRNEIAFRPKSKRRSRKSQTGTKAPKYVYYFGDGKADGDGNMKPLLGGKGANLAEMTRIGLPVPPGFTITTEVCTYYYENKRTYPQRTAGAGRSRARQRREIIGKKFGDTEAMPLLVSVRSGARDSMPGMMDTILNLGLNDDRGRDRGQADEATRVSPGIPIAASCRCTATWSWACRSARAKITSRSRA